jgi:aminomethyltransferase
VQGPLSLEVVGAVAATDLATLPYMAFRECALAGAPRGVVSRTGYTGELGYELIVPAEHGNELWDALLAAGAGSGMALIGLKAAFSLRLEKGYIARFDFADRVTPLEAGLGWTVKWDKGEFVGRQALLDQKARAVSRRLITLEVLDGYIPAGGEIVRRDGIVAGKVTSGGFGWAVSRPLGLALVNSASARVGTEVVVEAAGGAHPARVAPRSMYDPDGARLRG